MWSENSERFGFKELWLKKNHSKKLESKQNQNKKIRSKKSLVPKNWINKILVKKIFGSHKPFFKFWLKLDWYQLRYSIKFKVGQMLHGQMMMGKMI